MLVSTPTTTPVEIPPAIVRSITNSNAVPNVPFYSQFADVSSASWKKVACGITSLAMIISYYKDTAVSVDKLLAEGVAEGAYLKNAGWTYAGLINVAQNHGLEGETHDLQGQSSTRALANLKDSLDDGPVIASIHYKFDPKSTIPHLVVINAIIGDTVYYNDPAATTGQKQISIANFLKGWKKRFIIVRPSLA